MTDQSSESEPWKDPETLQRLYHEEDLNQEQIGDRLETTGSNISYWMDKLEINTSHTSHQRGEVEAVECCTDGCTNETPHPNNRICDACLDEARDEGRGHDTGS